jgi:hypothetical protein
MFAGERSAMRPMPPSQKIRAGVPVAERRTSARLSRNALFVLATASTHNVHFDDLALVARAVEMVVEASTSDVRFRFPLSSRRSSPSLR